MYAGTNCGSVLSAVSTVLEPVRAKNSWLTETIGLADSKSRCAIRVPVTRISSSSSCANAGEFDSAMITRHATGAGRPVAHPSTMDASRGATLLPSRWFGCPLCVT